MSDLISRQAAFIALNKRAENVSLKTRIGLLDAVRVIDELPSFDPGQCKRCKYFEYDSVAKVDGIPLIVAHEICKRWGDGCKTSEDGYCFLYEPQEMEVDG